MSYYQTQKIQWTANEPALGQGGLSLGSLFVKKLYRMAAQYWHFNHCWQDDYVKYHMKFKLTLPQVAKIYLSQHPV